MHVLDHFAHCPRCAARATRTAGERGPFRCRACGFVLFVNAASAVAALLVREDGLALFIERAKDPGKGQLGMPGGFVDAGESAEEALAREVLEEVGLEIAPLEYLSSHANHYFYAGVTYTTLDLFYTGHVPDPARARALDAVDGIQWLDPLTVDRDAIAFHSMRQALAVYRERHRNRP
jgi:ADP-ribose pyrophosphatase YjhB (NUDIX family)